MPFARVRRRRVDGRVVEGHSAWVNRIVQLGWLAGPYGAALVALAVAGAGVLLRRRWPGLAAVTGTVAALAGFGVLAPGVRGWAHPGGAGAALVGAVALLVAAGVLRGVLERRWGIRAGRWVGAAGLVGASWWVAGAVGGEVWRAVAGMTAAGVVVSRWGDRVAAGGLALWGGLVVAGVGMPWPAVGAVLAAAALGATGVGVVGMAGVLAVGVGAVELRAGRLGYGRFGAVDVACCMAVCAPIVAGWLERAVAGRIGRTWVARGVGVVGASAAGVGAGWVWARMGRG